MSSKEEVFSKISVRVCICVVNHDQTRHGEKLYESLIHQWQYNRHDVIDD
jgi:hypothetical protein